MNLFLYTMGFPYGEQETFLESELDLLCSEYDNVYIVPLKKKTFEKRDIKYYKNCFILEPLFLGSLKQENFSICTKGVINAIKMSPSLYNKVIFKNALISSIIKEKFKISTVWGDIKGLHKSGDIHYFYWAYGLAYNIKYIKEHLQNAKAVVRFHGFDLYEDRHNGWLPFRNEISEQADRLLFVSHQGLKYFNSKYPKSKDNSVLSYLGVDDGANVQRCNNRGLIFYSCSNIIDIKRVDLIFSSIYSYSLNNPNEQLEWHHFGDGELYDDLKSKISNQPALKNLRISLHGRRRSDYIFKYYTRKERAIFINLSTTEGLPVSIMEAMSFNIPIIATNVGGVSEMVTSSNGELVSYQCSPQDISEKIGDVINNYSNYSPYETWKQKFSSVKNYTHLIKLMKEI